MAGRFESLCDKDRIVASLDRKRLGADRWVEWGSQSEAFSMRRLGGSRWRLRRTRCAMGFERRSFAESSTGRTLVNRNGGVVISYASRAAYLCFATQSMIAKITIGIREMAK